jgi:hypothetical protein
MSGTPQFIQLVCSVVTKVALGLIVGVNDEDIGAGVLFVVDDGSLVGF